MKHDHLTDEQIQSAIDAACRETHAKHRSDIGTNLVLDTKAMPGAWESEAHVRRDLLKSALARLPEPTPPVVDGKTPGQACWETWAVIPPVIEHGWNLIQNKEAWDQAASTVLAAFGQPRLEAAIARMEAVPVEELNKTYWNSGQVANSEWGCDRVRARLIAAARDGQGEAVDWKAKAEYWSESYKFQQEKLLDQQARAEKAEAELAAATLTLDYVSETLDAMGVPSVLKQGSLSVEQRMDRALEELMGEKKTKLPQLRPIVEAGDVPEGCVRVYGLKRGNKFVVTMTQGPGDTHFADISLPAASQDGQLATFESHGKTWTHHTPGDPRPCDGEAKICVIYRTDESHEFNGIGMILDAKDLTWDEIIGWRYADEPTPAQPTPAWQPAVGDTVRLKSGGDALTVTEYDDAKNQWRCVGLTGGCPCYLCVPLACLTPAKEAQP
jgi:hypothetical protein